MSAKLLHTLSDENPDLQKQIGCMNGIFQLFDRHHFLGGRRINGHTHKRLPPGQGMEPNNAPHKAKDKNPKKFVKEKQRISTESSRTSFSSSSCSSTFSSVDCNRTAQTESFSHSQTGFPNTPSRDLPMTQPDASPRLGRQSLDLRDIVKDSIYREACGLSVKTAWKKEAVSHAVKHIDSPRPMRLSKEPIKVPVLDESLRTFGKLRGPPRNSNERKDGSLVLTPRDAPRFSYDGRESRDTFKSAIKLKDLPRLSLDSRESSMRGSASELKSNYLLRDLQKGNGNSSKMLSPQQEPGSNKRPSGVVAKLMGLDAFPDSSMSINDGQMEACPDGDTNPFSRSSKAAGESKQHRISGSPRNSHKDPVSPRLRNAGSVMKPTSTSRFPIEPAPWKQLDGSQGPQKPTFKHREAATKTLNSTPSIYGEIEKRLTELEFKKSGKDLRALKRILEAMQKTKETIEAKKDHNSNSVSQTSNSLGCSSPVRSSKVANSRNLQSNSPMSATIRGTSSPTSFKSPIVIMKPAKLIEKSHNLASSAIPIDGLSGLPRLQTGDLVGSRKDSVDKQTAKDLTPRNKHLKEPSSQPSRLLDKSSADRSSRLTKTSKVHQKINEENTSSSGRNSGAVSPRLQQKKLELDKQSRSTTPSPESSRVRRQSSRQLTEPSSPARKLRQRAPNLLQSDDQLSEISGDSRNLSYQGDADSIQSESNISLVSQIDIEVTSIDRSGGINSISFQHGGQKHKNGDGTMTKFATATQEQPSPVSVLDAAFYKDDLPSPVKKISNAFKDDETLNYDEMEWATVGLNHLYDSSRPSLSSDINHKKLENIENLVQRIRELNSTHNEFSVDLIASLCDKTNPDHRYISEILLASGLLRDCSGLMITKLHQSSHPINPKLFLVLEQNRDVANILNDKYSSQNTAQSKLQRKLIFDVVNEILFQKLAFTGSSEPCFLPNKIVRRSQNGQELLRELCSEIDQLQGNNSDCSLENEVSWEDIMHRSANRADFHGEVSGIALDVERLIFKDLIGEVLNGEAALSRARPRGHHYRQLFPK
ncbi:protein LONGIFOLIA 1 isoform X2 [Vitis vinifera]|uniref:protein LONGIFOLIA 1 isoform X2 n=1 Tax=Vitis vinifera TaxID=29760 RepID=UPI00053F41A4|nr:protein LONGIFOLIA 1 isoform X2 [Vitis vinifera]|eukprot:XP_010660611.1 PREDICTED: protein LONGIFOLIA 1 isoform X2 [Vitis vinifera]